MPHGLFRRGGHGNGQKHHHSEKDADKVPFEEYAELQQELQDLREELDDASENLELARITARTLEDVFRSEIKDAGELQSEFTASEAQVAELESQLRAGCGGDSEMSQALDAQKARVAELEMQHGASEERHKAVVSKLAAEAMAKASDSDAAKARLVHLETACEEAQSEAAELRKSVASATSGQDVELQKLRDELKAARDEELRLRAAEERQQLEHAELRAALVEVEAEAGERTSAQTSALVDSLQTSGELETLRTQVTELRHARHQEAAEADEFRHVCQEVRDLQGRIALRDAEFAELEAKLQLAEVQQPSAPSGHSSPASGRSSRRRGDDDGKLASMKAELAEQSELVAGLQSQLDAAAGEGLRLIDANTALEEQLQEMSDKNTQLSERLNSSTPAPDAQAMTERADDAVESSAGLLAEVGAFKAECASLRTELHEASDRPTLLAEVGAFQAECASLRTELHEASDRPTFLAEVVALQAECASLRTELREASDRSTLESMVEQATGRAAELLASLAASEATCDLLRGEATTAQAACDTAKAGAEALATELASAKEMAEDVSAELREELSQAEALEASSAQTAEELREELARECAGHSAAAAAADNALAAHTALRSEVAEAESAVEDSETWASKLQAEVVQERAGRDSETKAALALQQSQQSGKTHLAEVQTLRDELSREKRQASTEAAALAAAREQIAEAPEPASGGQEEIEELLSQVSDLQYALNITSEAAASLDDSGEPVGVQEARRFRAECAQLQSELQRSKAEARKASRKPPFPLDDRNWEEEASAPSAIDYTFGSGSLGDASEQTFKRVAPGTAAAQVDSPPSSKSHRRKSTKRNSPSFASCPEEVQGAAADSNNPFGDAGSKSKSSSPPPPPPLPPGFSFGPPQRTGLQGCDVAAEEAGNPFGQAEANPFEDEAAANPFEEEANPFEEEPAAVENPFGSEEQGNPFGGEEQGSPDQGNPFAGSPDQGNPFAGSPDEVNPFAADESADVGSEVLKQQSSSSIMRLEAERSTPSFSSKDVAAAQAAAAAEVAHLRAALKTEEKACIEAKAACAEAHEEAARGAKRGLAAASGADAGDEAGEVHQLRRALSDEAAKSRRLCEQALRAEESRRRLLHEMLEDSQAEVDVVQLAKLVGRAAKAIAAVSEVAPVRPAEQVSAAPAGTTTSVPMPAGATPAGSSAPSTVTPSPGPTRTESALEASGSHPGRTPQTSSSRTPQRLPCLPGLPAGSLAEVAVTPTRLAGIPGLPGPPRGSMATVPDYMDLR